MLAWRLSNIRTYPLCALVFRVHADSISETQHHHPVLHAGPMKNALVATVALLAVPSARAQGAIIGNGKVAIGVGEAGAVEVPYRGVPSLGVPDNDPIFGRGEFLFRTQDGTLHLSQHACQKQHKSLESRYSIITTLRCCEQECRNAYVTTTLDAVWAGSF
jgi:hypothetical protein